MVDHVRGELVFTPPKTAKGTREVPLDEETVSYASTASARSWSGRSTQRSTSITTWCSHGRTADRSTLAITQSFQVRRANAGLPHIRLHDLRHTAAMLSVEDNVHPELLRRRLGHSRVEVTIGLYMHGRADEAERGVADALAARIAAPAAARLRAVSAEGVSEDE